MSSRFACLTLLLLSPLLAAATTTAFPRFSSFFGGESQDSASRVIVDPLGRIIVVGYSFSADLPLTEQSGPGGETDVIVSAFSADGRQLLFSHRIGGSLRDLARDVALGADGDIYIAGETESFDFPLVNPYQAGNQGNPAGIDAADREAFVIRLAANDGRLLWSGYFGGSDYDAAHAIAVDASGRVFIGGETLSSDLPVTGGAFDRSCGNDGACDAGHFDAFVAVFQPGGPQQLLYASYIGGSDNDKAHSLAIAADGTRVYLAGETRSSDLPVRRGPFTEPLGDTDGFVTALDWGRSGADALQLGSYLGGSDEDVATVIRAGSAGTLIIAGETRSDNFPLLQSWFSNARGGSDAFISRLDGVSGRLLVSTRFGGSGDDSLTDLRIAADNGIWFAGNTGSGDFPLWSAAQQRPGGSQDGFIGRYDASLTVPLLSSYYGGSGEDTITGLALAGSTDFIITGDTESMSLPGIDAGWHRQQAGQVDMFVTALQSGDAAGNAGPVKIEKPVPAGAALDIAFTFLCPLLYTAFCLYRHRCRC